MQSKRFLGRGGALRTRLELSSASSSKSLTAALLVGVLALQLAMIGSYVGALHAPKPRGVPIAVAGPARLTAPLQARLRQGGLLAPRLVADAAAARRAIDEREVYAALIPTPGTDTLLTAPAASATVAELLPSALRRLEPPGRQLVVQVVKPLPSTDPRGIAPFYLIVGWLVGGYIAATILGLARGSAARNRRWAARRLGVLALYAIASGLLGTLLVQNAIGVLQGHTLALAAVGALMVFATGAATAGLQALLGIAGTALAILLFVALGNPGSGGPLAYELLMPGPWRTLGPLLPPGAGTTLVRNVAYFQANAIAVPLLVLAAYALVGSIITILAARHRTPTTIAETQPSAAAALAA